MVQALKLGSLYLDGKSIAPEAKYQPGQTISFGEAAPDMAISWVPVNGLLIADQCLLTNVSWDDLDAQGLVSGKEITVQGFRFQIRLLKVGSEDNVPNEWDAALDTVGEYDPLWHWRGKYFWGQESVSGVASYRVVRGYRSARLYNWNISSGRGASFGFRPALVPLDTEQLGPTLLGQQLMLWGGQSIVSGRLEQVTDYDAVLSNWSGTRPTGKDFSSQLPNGDLVVNRKAIAGVQKS